MSKGFPGNIQALMKQAQDMQKQLQKAQEVAVTLRAEGSTGGGMVKAIASGDNRIQSLIIKKEAVSPKDVDLLQDMIVAAINEALTGVQEKVQAEMSKATGGVSIPGLR